MKIRQWEPEGVACLRGSLRTGTSYDAELRWLDKHYVISTGHATREIAKAEADAKAKQLRGAIIAAVKPLIAGLKEAKP